MYGLGVDDPIIKEAEALKEANKYGLTRIEYEQRWRKARELCPLGSAEDCWDQVMKTGKY
jgi:hypothetical protein